MQEGYKSSNWSLIVPELDAAYHRSQFLKRRNQQGTKKIDYHEKETVPEDGYIQKDTNEIRDLAPLKKKTDTYQPKDSNGKYLLSNTLKN